MKTLNTNSLNAQTTMKMRILYRLMLISLMVSSLMISPPSTPPPHHYLLMSLLSSVKAEISRTQVQRSSKQQRSALRRRADLVTRTTTRTTRTVKRRHRHHNTRDAYPARINRRTSISPMTRVAHQSSTVFELGGSTYLPVQGIPYTAMTLGAGYRARGLGFGLLGEAQIVQGLRESRLYEVNAQFRTYLPLNTHIELFPLALIGVSHLMNDQSSTHFDVGLGVQFKPLPRFAMGARYQARMIASSTPITSTNAHQLTAQLSIEF